MSYRVIYDASGRQTAKAGKRKRSIPLMVCAFFALFLLVVKAFWEEGYQVLHEILWGENFDLLNRAVMFTRNEMEKGYSFSGAMEAFCTRLLNEASLVG